MKRRPRHAGSSGVGRRVEPADRIRGAYARVASSYDRRWARYVEESVVATVGALDPRPGERILDVACGTGWLLDLLSRRPEPLELVGLDLSSDMLRVAAEKLIEEGVEDSDGPGASLILGDAARLPFADGTFDAVVSSSALHHWPDPGMVIGEMNRVTGSGGRVVITDWCRDVPLFWPLALSLALVDGTVQRIFSRRDLERMLTSNGFGIESGSSYRVATFWGMMTVVGRKDGGSALVGGA